MSDWPWGLPGPMTEVGDPLSSHYVYVLLCGDGEAQEGDDDCYRIAEDADYRFYIGSTGDVIGRIDQHVNGDVLFTSRFPPIAITALHGFDTIRLARLHERNMATEWWKHFDPEEVFVYSC